MKKRRLLIVLGICLIIFAALPFALWHLARSRTYQAFGELVSRVETKEKVVALTFDDGPTPDLAGEILEILKEENVKATFFLVGESLQKFPEEGKAIAEAGHEIGNHSFSHERMALKSMSFIRREIEETDALIKETGYSPTPCFRPPYGKKLFALPWYLSRNNRISITWDVEPETYPEVARNSDSIAAHVIEKTRPGSIILLHVMFDRDRKSMKAVRPIIQDLKAKGYRFVTVAELLKFRAI